MKPLVRSLVCFRTYQRIARKRAHNLAEAEPITLARTVGRDLGKRRSAQRFLVVPW